MNITDEILDNDLNRIVNNSKDEDLKEMLDIINDNNLNYEEKQNRLCKVYWKQYTQDISDKEEIIEDNLKKY